MEETIEVIISKDGAVKLDAKGFSGKGCSIALNELAKALGSMSDFTKKTKFYDEEQTQEVNVTTKE